MNPDQCLGPQTCEASLDVSPQLGVAMPDTREERVVVALEPLLDETAPRRAVPVRSKVPFVVHEGSNAPLDRLRCRHERQLGAARCVVPVVIVGVARLLLDCLVEILDRLTTTQTSPLLDACDGPIAIERRPGRAVEFDLGRRVHIVGRIVEQMAVGVEALTEGDCRPHRLCHAGPLIVGGAQCLGNRVGGRPRGPGFQRPETQQLDNRRQAHRRRLSILGQQPVEVGGASRVAPSGDRDDPTVLEDREDRQEQSMVAAHCGTVELDPGTLLDPDDLMEHHGPIPAPGGFPYGVDLGGDAHPPLRGIGDPLGPTTVIDRLERDRFADDRLGEQAERAMVFREGSAHCILLRGRRRRRRRQPPAAVRVRR